MSARLVITLPDFDEVTRYFSAWSDPILEEASRKSYKATELIGDKATRERVENSLRGKGKLLVVFNGHGGPDTMCGQDNEDILDLQNVELLDDKITYARACDTATTLGPVAIRRGARAYIGYTIPFTFAIQNEYSARPKDDKLAALFLEPANEVPLSLLNGHTAKNANIRSRNAFRANIRQTLVAGPKSPTYYTLPYLYDDMVNQVCLGDSEATI
ncbi:MAG: C25 family cysteine peptidase [bacterium]|nr:C25 family cysteine peptidase [bacterium]